jgi:putative chitinase
MSYNITPEMLRRIAGASVSERIVNQIVEHLPEVIEKYKINTRLRLAHFLAQLAHESDHFRTYEEYASGSAYEGRRDLGNVKRGDGRRYKGRGPIQITGRYNYRKYGKLLGVDLENNPELAESPRLGLLIAGEYWKQKDLNSFADKDNGKQITRRINGGYNGLKDRLEKIERAKKVIPNLNTIPKVEKVVTVSEPKPIEEKIVENEPITYTLPIFAQTVDFVESDPPTDFTVTPKNGG